MGFGWLFIGYFFAFALAPLYSPLGILMPVGYGFLLFALSRLRPYHKYLNWCFYLTFLMLPFAFYYGIYGLSQLGVPLFPALFGHSVQEAMDWAYFGVWCFYQCVLLFAVASLCREVGHLPLLAMGTRNIVFVAIYAALTLVAHLPFIRHAAVFAVPLLLLRMMCVILNLWYCYKCYRAIVPDGAETPVPVGEEGTPDENT